MSEPRIISPLLDDFALGHSMSYHSGVNCYPAMRENSDERYIVKTISIPVSQTQLEALLLTGAYPNAEAARSYFLDLAQGIVSEVDVLGKLAQQRGFLSFDAYQIEPMAEGVGYEVYLLSHYRRSLDRFLKRSPMTHLSALNMGIDLCAALAVCREAGYLYVNLKPSNIYLSGEQEYHIGDLGFVRLDSLKYASLPDRCRSNWTPPEVSDAYAQLNDTMDTYALGMVLYQVYNNGQLPFDSEESRQELMKRMADGEPLPAPMYADYEMAQIIAKACAYNPEERWANPSEMGHALISYMQRIGANDVPIGPPPVSEPVEVPPKEPAPEETEAAQPMDEAVQAQADVSEAPDVPEAQEEDPSDADDPSEETAPQTEETEVEEPAEDSWIDQVEAILAEDTDGSVDDTEDGPSLREILYSDDAAIEDAQAAELDEQAVSDDIAAILSQADELIAHETPEPVEISIPQPTVPETGGETGTDEDEPDEISEDAQADDEGPEIPEENEDVPPKSKSKVKKVLGWIAAIVILAALGAGGYYGYTEYYLQEVTSLTVTGQAETMTISVTSELDESLLTVVCVDQYGAKLTAPVEGGVAQFIELTPDTQYNISLEVEGFHKLTGQISTQYYTLPQTNVVSISAVTGPEDGSVILSFATEGPAVENWTVEYRAEGLEPASLSFTGTMVTIPGLTPGTEYTFTLSAGEGVSLIGQTQITHTATNVIYAENLSITDLTDGTITVIWNTPEGVSVNGWTVRCYNESGYDQALNVTETTAQFSEISTSAAYTVEVTAAGMTQSQRAYITANPVIVTAINTEVSAGALNISWEFEGAAPEGGWLLVYTLDQGKDQHLVQCTEPSAAISPVAPGSHYDVSIQAANSATVFGGTTGADIPEASVFAQMKLTTSDITAQLCKAPAESGWSYRDVDAATNTFAAGDAVGVMLTTKKNYSNSDDSITTLFVVRNSEGQAVTISSSTAKWSNMWSKGHCDLNVPQVPSTPGTYSLEVYMAGQLLSILEMVIA